MTIPRSVDYRTSARPDLSFSLGKKPGPVVAQRRVAPVSIACIFAIASVLAWVAVHTPDATVELVAGSPLFSALYTFSILGLVGFFTLVLMKVAVFDGNAPKLRVGPEELSIRRPEGALSAPLQAVSRQSVVVSHGERERGAVDLLFPSGARVRIVCADRDERIEHEDPWDYSLEEDDFLELRRRLG